MLIKKRPIWLPKGLVPTPERVYRDRRQFLAMLGVGAAVGASVARAARGQPPPEGRGRGDEVAPGPGEAPRRNAAFTLDRPVTPERLSTRHNIFDELSPHKDEVWKAAASFRTSPWPVHIGGSVERAITLDVEELIARFGVEERLYRHRCVETWSMAVPWVGFPLRKLVELAAPSSHARYVRFVSFSDPQQAPAWYATRRVFPYYEALTLEEATHDLAFVATGLYGKPLPPQNGAPLRLVVPWKYGFKSIKSIAGIQFTRQRPGTFWSELAPHLYDFHANVDPTAVEPWSQAEETLLGEEEKRPTLPFNGYADLVASLYR